MIYLERYIKNKYINIFVDNIIIMLMLYQLCILINKLFIQIYKLCIIIYNLLKIVPMYIMELFLYNYIIISTIYSYNLYNEYDMIKGLPKYKNIGIYAIIISCLSYIPCVYLTVLNNVHTIILSQHFSELISGACSIIWLALALKYNSIIAVCFVFGGTIYTIYNTINSLKPYERI